MGYGYSKPQNTKTAQAVPVAAVVAEEEIVKERQLKGEIKEAVTPPEQSTVDKLYSMVTAGIPKYKGKVPLYKPGQSTICFYFDEKQVQELKIDQDIVRWEVLSRLTDRGFAATFDKRPEPLSSDWLKHEYVYRATVIF